MYLKPSPFLSILIETVRFMFQHRFNHQLKKRPEKESSQVGLNAYIGFIYYRKS